jgi:hypothetical protein
MSRGVFFNREEVFSQKLMSQTRCASRGNNKQVKSCVENLARYVDKEDKIGGVVIISALFGTDIPGSQYR